MTFFHNPVRVFQGPGVSRQLGAELDRMGVSRALLVSDTTLLRLGHVAVCEEMLGDRCVGVFADVIPDSSPHCVTGAAAVGEAYGADVVVALGGGSVMDTAKLAAAVLGSGQPFASHLGLNNVQGQPLPLVCLPTTSGTGSEVSMSAMSREANLQKKYVLRDAKLLPVTALLDPAWLATQPPALIAHTGCDALSHALEAWVSTWASPLTDAPAAHALRLLLTHLPAAVQNPGEIDLLASLQWAATLAGLAFNTAAVGLVHALSHVISARHHAAHGALNAVLLGPVLRFNLPVATLRLAALSRQLGLAAHAKTEEAAALKLIEKIEALVAALPVARSLDALGVPSRAIPNMAQETLKEPCLFTNPREVTTPQPLEELLAGLFSPAGVAHD